MAKLRWVLAAGLLLAGGAAAYGLAQVPILQDAPKPKVDRLTDADDDLLPVKPKQEAGDGLLDPYPDKDAKANKDGDGKQGRSLAAKAGKHASPGINAAFGFDLVFGYHAQVPEAGFIQSYFLLDSRRGHVGLDRGALESMGNMSASTSDGSFDFQVMTNSGEIYAYTTSREAGKVAMTLRAGEGAVGRDLDAYMSGDWFESSFKPTGQVRDIGMDLSNKPYRSVEYSGIDPESGTPLKLWLAKPDFEVDFYGASYMGVGIVPLPKADVQKLVTRMEGAGAVFELSYVMRKRKTFSGASYQDMSTLMGAYGRSAAGGH